MANKKLKTIQFPGLPDTYTIPQVENGANNNVAALDGAGNVKDSTIEVSKVAKTDGSYQSLNAGTSDQLNATVGITDKVPYNFRTAGGSADIGNRLNDKIVGGTIVWNQLVQNGNFESASYWSKVGQGTISVSENVLSYTCDGTTSSEGVYYNDTSAGVVSEHKYLVMVDARANEDAETIFLMPYFSTQKFDSARNVIRKKLTTLFTSYTAILSAKADNDSRTYMIGIRKDGVDATGSTITVEMRNAQSFDLTQMFGSIIANYIYSLEQTTAGAGVAWFKKFFQKSYYAYNAGELMSVCTNEHITRGFNAYNHETGKAKLIGGNAYQITGTYTSLSYSTGETISPDESGLFTPMENGILTVTGGNTTDTCVHLVWSGCRNGEYEPYIEHNYPLSPVELRGIPKLDSANILYFDGDTYKKDGTVTRKYGIVDLSTLSWTYNNAYGFYANINKLKRVDTQLILNATSNLYPMTTYAEIANKKALGTPIYAMCSKRLDVTANGIIIQDGANEDINVLAPKLVGKYLVYELETATAETANPFIDPQVVDDFGTEEYVDALATAETSPRDVAIPVGHETFYQANLRDKLQNLPSNASTDGLYLVKQTGNKQELIAYTPESELPIIQTEGTYVLKSINGVLTWVLES
jgi:hypothetical protein